MQEQKPRRILSALRAATQMWRRIVEPVVVLSATSRRRRSTCLLLHQQQSISGRSAKWQACLCVRRLGADGWDRVGWLNGTIVDDDHRLTAELPGGHRLLNLVRRARGGSRSLGWRSRRRECWTRSIYLAGSRPRQQTAAASRPPVETESHRFNRIQRPSLPVRRRLLGWLAGRLSVCIKRTTSSQLALRLSSSCRPTVGIADAAADAAAWLADIWQIQWFLSSAYLTINQYISRLFTDRSVLTEEVTTPTTGHSEHVVNYNKVGSRTQRIASFGLYSGFVRLLNKRFFRSLMYKRLE